MLWAEGTCVHELRGPWTHPCCSLAPAPFLVSRGHSLSRPSVSSGSACGAVGDRVPKTSPACAHGSSGGGLSDPGHGQWQAFQTAGTSANSHSQGAAAPFEELRKARSGSVASKAGGTGWAEQAGGGARQTRSGFTAGGAGNSLGLAFVGRCRPAQLLPPSCHLSPQVRSQALLFIKRMYEKEQLREYVEKFALNYLQLLVHPNPPSVLFGADKDTGLVHIHQMPVEHVL